MPTTQHTRNGLSCEALIWAASHDWFIAPAQRPDGAHTAKVLDEVVFDDGGLIPALQGEGYTISKRLRAGYIAHRTMEFDSLRALRAWAGY